MAVGTAAVGALLLLGGVGVAVSSGVGSSTTLFGLLFATAGVLLIVAGVGRFDGWTWYAGTAGLVVAAVLAVIRGGPFAVSGIVTLFIVAYAIANRAGRLGRRL